LLVGLDTFDDAGVYRISDDLALVQTVDFFTPVVDDPFDWGRIAAANALSDIYAMGAVPVTALNLLSFPVGKLDLAVAARILAGGLAKVNEAGALLLGGHSIDDPEPKYGLAVTGFVHPDKVVTNAGARPGDCLVLTKPIGVGIVTTALKRGLLSPAAEAHVTEIMATLNRGAMEAMVAAGAHAATDITGFGLLGHLWELARASGVGLDLSAAAVPVLPETYGMLAAGALPGGSKANRQYLESEGAVAFDPEVDEASRAIMTDANTSGGLVISIPNEQCAGLLALLEAKGTPARAVIGRVSADRPGLIRVHR
jgi:selenide,water dikinase